jgi:hypothetical protein
MTGAAQTERRLIQAEKRKKMLGQKAAEAWRLKASLDHRLAQKPRPAHTYRSNKNSTTTKRGAESRGTL